MSVKSKALSVAMSVVLAVGLCPAPAFAAGGDALAAASVAIQSDNIASGIWGTCPWEISADGVLTVHPGRGSDEFHMNSYWYEYSDSVTTIRFVQEDGAKAVAPASMYGMFRQMEKVESIDLSGLDTANVTSMYDMCCECSSLKELDLSVLDTSQVRDMSGMFQWCGSLESVTLSNIDTSQVESMHDMFRYCSSLSALNLTALDTSQVENFSCMFDGCSSLSLLDLSQFNTSKATNMVQMFSGCSKISILDLSHFVTSSVTDMNRMFANCSLLASINLSSFNTSNVKDMRGMFANCPALTTLDLSAFNTDSLQSTGGESWYLGGMFENCSSLKTVRVGDLWSMARVENATNMFAGCTSIVGGNGTTYDAAHVGGEFAHIDLTGFPGYLTDGGDSSKTTIVNAAFDEVPDQILAGGAVEPAVTLRIGDTPLAAGHDYDLSYVKNSDYGTGVVMAVGKGAYRGIAWTSFRILTANGDLAEGTWGSCKWEISTEGVLTVHPGIGEDCGHDWSAVRTVPPWLEYRDVIRSAVFAKENGASVVASGSIHCLLYRLVNLEIADLSGLVTTGVTDMSYVFYECGSLTSANVSGLDTSEVTFMECMFDGCEKLEAVDLSSFDTGKLGALGQMFSGCETLETIYVGAGWALADDVDSGLMFEGCYSLVGGNGTKYASAHRDAEYARIDKAGAPGYFTDINSASPVDNGPVDEGPVDEGARENPPSNDKPTTDSPSEKSPVADSSSDKDLAAGATVKVAGATYKVTDASAATVSYQAPPKSKKAATVPASVTINGKKYAVTGIAKNAFKKSKAKTVTIRSAKLTKKGVKGCFKGSKVKVVKVKVGGKKANAKAVKKYKKYFTKANCGAKVTLKVG